MGRHKARKVATPLSSNADHARLYRFLISRHTQSCLLPCSWDALISSVSGGTLHKHLDRTPRSSPALTVPPFPHTQLNQSPAVSMFRHRRLWRPALKLPPATAITHAALSADGGGVTPSRDAGPAMVQWWSKWWSRVGTECGPITVRVWSNGDTCRTESTKSLLALPLGSCGGQIISSHPAPLVIRPESCDTPPISPQPPAILRTTLTKRALGDGGGEAANGYGLSLSLGRFPNLGGVRWLLTSQRPADSNENYSRWVDGRDEADKWNEEAIGDGAWKAVWWGTCGQPRRVE